MITMESVRRVLFDENGWAEQDRGTETVFSNLGVGRVVLPSGDRTLSDGEERVLFAEMVACGLADDTTMARSLFDGGSEH